ncbi:MAG: uroporphyrinogen decarboxylase [Longimicrobiales bacterium]
MTSADPAKHEAAARPTPRNDRILRALRREPVDTTPVWFMRQAGRSLPRYREVRTERDMFDVIRDPEAAARVTELPLEYYNVDAAILYNDLSTPFPAAGFDVELRRGVGPVVRNPLMGPEDLDRLEPFDVQDALGFTMEQIRILVARLDVPLLAFVGAPFTMCTYLVGGSGTKNVDELKAFMYAYPDAWDRLATYWATHQAEYAYWQYVAGAAAVQVFDSWAGALAPDDYAEYVLPYAQRLLDHCAELGVPTIHFATGNPALLPLIADAGGDCVGVDWRLPIDMAWEMIGEERAIQGNLDPATLLAGREAAVPGTRDIMARVAGRAGHIFNTGHGLLPGTEPAVVREVVDLVHELGAVP